VASIYSDSQTGKTSSRLTQGHELLTGG